MRKHPLIKEGYTEPIELLKEWLVFNPVQYTEILGEDICTLCGSTSEGHTDDCLWLRTKSYLEKEGFIRE